MKAFFRLALGAAAATLLTPAGPTGAQFLIIGNDE